MPDRPSRDRQAPAPTQQHPTLLSSVCHDLRAPLAAVQMGTSFVLQSTPDSPDNERARKILAAVLRSCGQMDRLLRNFSDLAHLEAKDIVLELSEHDARSVAEIAVDSMRETASSRSIDLVLDIPDYPVALLADRERLVRGLGHLIENAIKHGPDRSRVEVTMTPRKDVVEWCVTDHGPGLADDVRAHLFDRVWHSTRAGRSGTGLGLAIARGFAELHGGHLRADAPPGGPTRFVLSVPRKV